MEERKREINCGELERLGKFLHRDTTVKGLELEELDSIFTEMGDLAKLTSPIPGATIANVEKLEELHREILKKYGGKKLSVLFEENCKDGT